MIWCKVFVKLRVPLDGLVSRKEVLSESIYCVETHIYMVVGVIESQSSFPFEFCLDEDFV